MDNYFMDEAERMAGALGNPNPMMHVAHGANPNADGGGSARGGSAKPARKFQFIRHIGGGSFGEIYSGIDPKTDEKVAIKVESNQVRNPQLYLEYTIYSKYLQDCTGFPKVYHYAHTKKHNYFVMTLLGHNLEYLFEKCDRQFSDKTLLMLAEQLIARLELLHDRTGYLHRDIKPENILMGTRQTNSIVYLVDLGLAKLFIDRSTGQHIIPRKLRKNLTGTARYASINAHHGRDQSRRDDMESAGYVLIYFAKGRLPWQGIKASNKKQRYERICEVKMRTTTMDLCAGLIPEFQLFLDYVKKLSFEERPDYGLLRGMFLEVMAAKGFENDGVFDWFYMSNFSTEE